MRSLGRALVALAALGLVMGLAAVAVVLTSRHMADRGAYAAFTAALGASFLGTGLYAWWRRPNNRSGALIAWVGFLWFLAPLEFSENDVVFTVGQFTDPLPIAALAHLIVAFPNGRLESRYHRWLIGAGYFTATLLQLPTVLTLDDASNLLLASPDAGFNHFWARLVNVCAIAVIALVAFEVLRRLRRGHGSERQVYGPVIYASVASLAAFAALFVSAEIGGEGASALRFLALGVFVTVPYAFLAGLIRGRLSRATAVAELVEALGQTDHRRQTLRETIATALGDSSLALAYWIPEQQAYVDAQGFRVALPEPGSGRIATPIEHAGEPLAVMVHDESLADERDLVRAVGGAAALTLENERLAAELRARIEELRASRTRIVQAGDEERRRLERDLHDGAQQRLVALALNLKLARSSFEHDPEAALESIDDAVKELTETTAELRELARGIHPAILTDRGLDAAVNALAGRASVPVEVGELPGERLAAPVESTAYFVIAEALTNVARYSQASHAEVDVGRQNGTLIVEVRDDGVGGADPDRGSGLRGLGDRVAAVDGRLRVTSEPGSGTVVHVEIPCAQ